MSRFSRRLFVEATLLVVFAFSGWAQTPVTVAGTLTYAGAAVVPSASPTFDLRNESTGAAVTVPISYAAGAFQIQGLLPGSYGLQVKSDENPANPSDYPGDFYSWTTFNAATAAANGLVVRMRRVIHLTSPHDNSSAFAVAVGACTKPLVPTTSVRIAWDPVPSAATYHYTIMRMSCTPYAPLETVASETTSNTSFSQALAANGVNDVYVLTLSANTADGTDVGILVTHGPNWEGYDHRFTVPPPADLAISKRIERRFRWWPPMVTRTCIIEVRNLGPASASYVVVKDSAPPNWFTGRVVAVGWICEQSGNTMKCGMATLPAGALSRISIPLTRQASGSNTVTVSSLTPDPVSTNNVATASTP